MVKKNKLYKHHKSKAFFVIRNFSFALAALLGAGTAVVVPTYIASIKNEEINIKALSQNENENDVEEVGESELENQELETY